MKYDSRRGFVAGKQDSKVLKREMIFKDRNRGKFLGRFVLFEEEVGVCVGEGKRRSWVGTYFLSPQVEQSLSGEPISEAGRRRQNVNRAELRYAVEVMGEKIDNSQFEGNIFINAQSFWVCS